MVLTRRARPGPFRQVEWDGRTVGAWSVELEGSAVVNLAGELVDRRPTAANVDLLTRSRVEPTRALVEASATLAEPVPVWVQASTLAIYGDAGDQVLDESALPADGPPQMTGVAQAWEAAASGANTECLVTLRTGIILGNDTAALERLWSLARWGLGGRVGPGTQWVSWIHIEDWLAIVRQFLLPGGPALTGVVHATGPRPVRNADLMAALRRSVGRRLRLLRLRCWSVWARWCCGLTLRWRSRDVAPSPLGCWTPDSNSGIPTSTKHLRTCGLATSQAGDCASDDSGVMARVTPNSPRRPGRCGPLPCTWLVSPAWSSSSTRSSG